MCCRAATAHVISEYLQPIQGKVTLPLKLSLLENAVTGQWFLSL